MQRWFTADWHLGHARIIELAQRPFADVEQMNLELIARFNESVPDGARIWHLGDFAMGKIGETLPLASCLVGENVLIAGNHDRMWPGSRGNHEEWQRRYVAAGFANVLTQTEYVAQIGTTRVHLAHLPYRGDSREMPDRFPEWRPADNDEWLLHGHVHARWRQKGKMINVGVDAWGGRPVSEEQIAELIAAGPRDLEPLPW